LNKNTHNNFPLLSTLLRVPYTSNFCRRQKGSVKIKTKNSPAATGACRDDLLRQVRSTASALAAMTMSRRSGSLARRAARREIADSLRLSCFIKTTFGKMGKNFRENCV
jgi:hypothetical protein